MSYTVHGASCSYANLSTYNSSSDGTLSSPAFRASANRDSYVIPQYGAVGYNTLTHENSDPSCAGYFNIQSAYGANADDCNTQYGNTDCAGNNIEPEQQRMMRRNQFQDHNPIVNPGPPMPPGPTRRPIVNPIPTKL